MVISLLSSDSTDLVPLSEPGSTTPNFGDKSAAQRVVSPASTTCFGDLHGNSVPMRCVFSLLSRAAACSATVLIEGESGTGKDLAANAIHAASERANGPFIVVDCASIPPNLVESELFGHKKGAFTSALRDRAGAFECAHGGTLFLDEIGELPLDVQPKLLRALESREVRPVGDFHYRPFDVRLIAATNRNLSTEVAAGRFRQDLFYRVSVLTAHMPPLRERMEDLPLLSRHLISHLRPDVDPAQIVNQEVLSLFTSYSWPGNVRELRNVIELLMILPEHALSILTSKEPPEALNDAMAPEAYLLSLPYREARRIWNDRFDRAYLGSLLERNQGIIARAARDADIPRQTLHRLVSKIGFKKVDQT